MTIIPFHNHYSEKGKSVTAEGLKTIFRDDFYLDERACLCSIPSEDNLPVVLVHGSRDINSPCYDAIKRQISTASNTHFYIFAFSLGFGQHAFENVKKRIGEHPNYMPVVGFNLEESLERIGGLLVARQGGIYG